MHQPNYLFSNRFVFTRMCLCSVLCSLLPYSQLVTIWFRRPAAVEISSLCDNNQKDITGTKGNLGLLEGFKYPESARLSWVKPPSFLNVQRSWTHITLLQGSLCA